MTNNPKDGGAAFPTPITNCAMTKGMSLRDWFAGRAISACFAEVMKEYKWGEWDAIYQEVSCMAYQLADAMIAQSQKETDDE